MSNFDITQIRADFPNLDVQINGKPIVYFDNGATTFKPKAVIDSLQEHYTKRTSNIHRGLHTLSEEATTEFESSRETVRDFINAKNVEEIIFTGGTTDSINLVSQCFSKAFLKEGDEVLISHMEHHSNIVPWQMVCEEKGCILKVIPINQDGEIIQDEYETLLTDKVKLVSLVHISNSLGTINPIQQMIEKAHAKNIPILIDAAQSISHQTIDVQTLDCDFLAFSSHKLFGPTGVGVLYGKKDLLNQMPPYRGGGDMIERVSFEKTTYNTLPHKFEAGTPNIADVIALKQSIKYLKNIGMAEIHQHKDCLTEYGTKKLATISSLKMIGTASKKAPIFSFQIEDIHPQDLGTVLNQEGIAVRTGHHCTMPVMDFFKITGTTRASLSLYNTIEEIDQFTEALNRSIKLLK